MHSNIAAGRANALAMQTAAAEKFHAKGGGLKTAAAAAAAPLHGEQTLGATSKISDKPSQAALLGAAAAAAQQQPDADGRPWEDEEQKVLEQGLKLFPSSLKDERWKNIAGANCEYAPGRDAIPSK